MADDERPDTNASEDSENPPPRRGLGRFASRFRREQPEQTEVDATPPPEGNDDQDAPWDDQDAPWIVPAALDRGSGGPDPEPLAPELDLTLRPPSETVAEADAEAQSPPYEPDPESATDQAGAAALDVEPADEPIEASTEPDPEPVATPALATDDEPSAQAPEPAAESPRTPDPVPSTAPGPVPSPVASPALSPVLVAPASEFDEDPQEVEEQAWVPRTRAAGISAHLAVLTAVATSIIMAFLLIEPSPRWLLLLGAAAVVFGLDGTLRQTWRAPFSFGQETAPFLFVPALYMMAVPVLIEHNVSGELVFLVGLGAGFGFGALAWAELASVRSQAPEYEQARVIVTANTYLTGFAIFSLSYVFEISLLAAIIATSIAAAMLAVEVLREGEIDPMETLGLSLVTGVIIGEARWLLYYIPLDTYLAGLTLLLVFYLATGLLHSHVIRALNRVVAFEYSGIAAAGLALVILARAVGLA